MSFDSNSNWGDGEDVAQSEHSPARRAKVKPAAAALMIIGGVLLLVSLYIKLTAPIPEPAAGYTFVQQFGWAIGAVVGVLVMLIGNRVNKAR